MYVGRVRGMSMMLCVVLLWMVCDVCYLYMCVRLFCVCVLLRGSVCVVAVFVYMSTPSVAQLVERLTVVVDAVLGILRNQLVTSSILVVRTSLSHSAFRFSLFVFRFIAVSLYRCIASSLLALSFLALSFLALSLLASHFVPLASGFALPASHFAPLASRFALYRNRRYYYVVQ